jgi:Aspartyl protease
MADFERLPSPISMDFDHHRPYGGTGGAPRTLVKFRNPALASESTLLGHTTVLVTVDSGADVTMLPKRYAAPLHIDLTQYLPLRSTTGAGGIRVPCYQKTWLEASLCGRWIRLPVVFFAGENTRGLLGRAGAFEALNLTFVHGQKTMYAALAT